MHKTHLLSEIRRSAAERLVSRDEVTNAFDEGEREIAVAQPTSQAGISQILYYVGAAIVFLGISVLIWQHWRELNGLTKILSTLGSGIAAYVAAVFLSQDKRFEQVGGGLYFLAALAIPVGLHVTFHVAGFDTESNGVQTIVSAILLTTFLLSYFANPKTVFLLFSILFGTWLFFSLSNQLLTGIPVTWRFTAYRVLFTGFVYAALGVCLAETPRESLTGWLYSFGTMLFLGSALVLGGWKPHQSVLWELLFPALVFGVMYLSVFLKSRAFLTFSSLYLMAYIMKLTSEYFAGSIGWPIALVLSGFGLIAIGYLHFNLKSKYLS